MPYLNVEMEYSVQVNPEMNTTSATHPLSPSRQLKVLKVFWRNKSELLDYIYHRIIYDELGFPKA